VLVRHEDPLANNDNPGQIWIGDGRYRGDLLDKRFEWQFAAPPLAILKSLDFQTWLCFRHGFR
jgi:hypothetical protein